MADQSTEQRTLPPSLRKLRTLRKKGQVATSKDLVGAVTLVLAIGYLVTNAGSIGAAMQRVFDAATSNAADDGRSALREMVAPAIALFLSSSTGLFGVVVFGALLANLAVLRGVPLSFDPVKPNFDRLNPLSGLKRILGLKAWIELSKSACKTALLGTLLLGVLANSLSGLLVLPSCGTKCLGDYVGLLTRDILLCAAALFISFGLLDVGLQSWLFRRDQKMGVSETKRDRKESEGDPIIRRARRRLMAEAREASAVPAQKPSLIVFDGRNTAFGIHFVRGKTPVPVMVSRASGKHVETMLDRAAELNIGVAVDAPLADMLRQTLPGNYIPAEAYQAVANALRSAGLLG